MTTTDDNDKPARAGGKHLLSKEELSEHAGSNTDDMSRGHHQGNGLRVHGIYFLVVSVVALALLIAVIAVASAM